MGGSSSAPIPGEVKPYRCFVHVQVIETLSGSVRGRQYETNDGRIVDGFLGIPYAAPPIGELRFQKPQRHEGWSDTLDCFYFGPRCPQTDEYFSSYLNIVGKDEASCLTLNVFAPRWESAEFGKRRPVMVWIHGGGFVMHSSSNYGDRTIARNLCSKDIVVVSVNYRLGLFGFFTTGDEHCSGNMGLWDQTLALQWVNENIDRFGGDAKNITVFGQSAGGASSDLLSLSPHSRDLFQKVIPMAGCAECDFAAKSSKELVQTSRAFAEHLGFKAKYASDEKLASLELLAWLREQPAAKLELGLSGKRGFSRSAELIFTPNVDGDFFPKPLEELRKEAPRKPRMTGVTEHEGLFFASLNRASKTFENTQKAIGRFCPPKHYDNCEVVAERLKSFYLKDVDHKDKETIMRRFVDAFGDWGINAGVYQQARLEADLGSEVYLYSFDYYNPDGFGIMKWILPYLGATHCMELRYILGKGIICKFRPNAQDLEMIEIASNFFVNFAKYGFGLLCEWPNSLSNPNGKSDAVLWKPFTSSRPGQHLSITLTPAMKDTFLDDRPLFWFENIYPNRKQRCHL